MIIDPILNFFNKQFFLMKGDWMKKVLLAILGASTLLAALCMIGCGTEPRGREGKITLSDSVFTGTNGSVTITLKDADVTDPSVKVKVASSADPVGTSFTLSGSNGVFTGTLKFSVSATNKDTILVDNFSLVTVTYKDAFPAGDRTQTMIWKGTTGTILLDAASYTSVIKPMTITVRDNDVSVPSVLVTLNTSSSSATILVTLKSTGTYGEYSGKIVFSTRVNNADTLLVKDNDVVSVTYKDDITQKSSNATAVWKGIAGVVTTDKANYVAFAAPMTITLVDSDLTSPTVSVTVKSTTDTAGITAVLKPVAGAKATYQGTMAFTLNASVEGTSIKVSDNDNVTVVYKDGSPVGLVTKTAVWNGIVGTVSLDSASYKGQSKMTITVDDADVLDSTVTVKVKSEKDTAGIIVTLKANAGKFTGQVGFSYGASSANAIAAADSDTVMVIYQDMIPVTTVTNTAVYYMGLIPALGIFSNNATPGATQKAGLLPRLITWSGTVTVDSVLNHAGNANTVRLTSTAAANWAGAGWSQCTDLTSVPPVPAGINMSEYKAANANCSLHVWMKGTASIEILIEDLNPGVNGALQTWVPAANYGYVADDSWYEVKIPLTAWTNCDFLNVSYLMGMRFVPFAAGLTIAVDDIYWTLPQN
jgi:hypothetical protein